MTALRQKLIDELQLRGYAERTVESYVAVTLSLGGPACCGCQCFGGGSVDERLEGDLAALARDELGVDSPFRKARVKKLYPLGDSRVLLGTEKGI